MNARILKNHVFSGFSTVNNSIAGKQALHDIALVNQDITNHFNTRIGERVMRPGFGCRIWEYFMEPLTEYNKSQIVAEATRVCEEDTRVSVMNIYVTEIESGIVVELNLLYKPFEVVGSFQINFENNQLASLSSSF